MDGVGMGLREDCLLAYCLLIACSNEMVGMDCWDEKHYIAFLWIHRFILLTLLPSTQLRPSSPSLAPE